VKLLLLTENLNDIPKTRNGTSGIGKERKKIRLKHGNGIFKHGAIKNGIKKIFN
jgi:hypothetical protein